MSIMDVSRPLKLMTWNAHSLRRRKIEFFNFLETQGIAIACTSETYLNETDSLSHPLFVTYRLDREPPQTGGGVAITVRRGVKHRLLPCPQTRAVEALSVEFTCSEGVFVVTSVYFPGSVSPETSS